MVAPVTNSANTSYAQASLKLSGPNPLEQKNITNLNRDELEKLSNAVSGKIQTQQINPMDEIKDTPRWLDPLLNFGKNIGSLAFKSAGIFGAGLAFLSYFVFNLKTLSVIFGIPTLAAFYLSYTLKQKIHESGKSLELDPIRGLQKIIYEEKINQETDPSTLLKYIHDVKEIYNTTKSYESETTLKAVESMVDAKLYELQRLGDADSHEVDTVEFQKNLERYKEALSDWNLVS